MNIFDLIIEEIKQRNRHANEHKHPNKYVHNAYISGLQEAIRIIKKIKEECK